MHGFDHFIGQLADRDAALQSTPDDLVIDIRDVSHIGHLQIAGLEPPLNHIKSHHHPCVADMTQVIDRHATDIHAHVTGLKRSEGLQRTRKRVENAQTHGYQKPEHKNNEPATSQKDAKRARKQSNRGGCPRGCTLTPRLQCPQYKALRRG